MPEPSIHDTVYQFQPVADARVNRLDQLEPGTLWVSDPASFNDPFDLRLYIRDLTGRSPFADPARLRHALGCLLAGNAALHDHWLFDAALLATLQEWVAGRCDNAAVIDAVQRRLDGIGVACFSTGWRSPLMWSHYADSHAGFCIEYRVDRARLSADALGRQRFLQQPVQYVSRLPETCLTEVLFAPHQVLGRLLATKGIEWAYEREWRLLHLAASRTRVALPAGMAVSALIGGIRMAAEDRRALAAQARRLGVPAYRVETGPRYEMELKPLDAPAGDTGTAPPGGAAAGSAGSDGR